MTATATLTVLFRCCSLSKKRTIADHSSPQKPTPNRWDEWSYPDSSTANRAVPLAVGTRGSELSPVDRVVLAALGSLEGTATLFGAGTAAEQAGVRAWRRGTRLVRGAFDGSTAGHRRGLDAVPRQSARLCVLQPPDDAFAHVAAQVEQRAGV